MTVAKHQDWTIVARNGVSVASHSFSVSSGADRMLAVIIGTEQVSGVDIENIFYGGQALQKVFNAQTFLNNNVNLVSFWYLLENGINNASDDIISVHSNRTINFSVAAGTYNNVDQRKGPLTVPFTALNNLNLSTQSIEIVGKAGVAVIAGRSTAVGNLDDTEWTDISSQKAVIASNHALAIAHATIADGFILENGHSFYASGGGIRNGFGAIVLGPSGNDSPGYEFIADFVGSGQSIPFQDVYGIRIKRSVASFFDRYAIGTATLILDNSQNQYTNSLQVNQSVTIKAISPQNSAYTLFKGTLENFSFNPRVGTDEVTLRLNDLTQRFRERINLPLITDTVIASACIDVLSAVGFTGNAAEVSSSLNDPIPFRYLDDKRAGESLYELVQAAGTFSYVDGGGNAIVRNRNFDIGRSVVASLDTYFSYRAGLSRRRLINRATIASDPRAADTDTRTVAWFEEQTEITNSDTFTLFLDHVDPDTRERNTPATAFATPVASQDYLFTTQVSGGGTVINGALSIQLTHYALVTKAVITNAGSQTGYLGYLTLRGTAIKRQAAFSQTFDNSSSQNVYGLEEFIVNNDLVVSPLFANTYAQSLISNYGDPPLELRIAIRNQFPEAYIVDGLDIVHLVNTQTSVASDFVIFGVEHDIDFRRGLQHTLVLDGRLRIDKKFLILGRDPEGLLDQRRLGF